RILLEPTNHNLFLSERLLLIQIDHVRQKNADVQSVIRACSRHCTQDREPGGKTVARGLVEDRPNPLRREPKAHLRKLDVDAAGIERNVDHVPIFGDAEAAHLEHDTERENGRIAELEAGMSSLLML